MIPNHNKKALITHYIIVGFIGIFILIVVMTNLYLAKERELEKAFYPNVYIDNKNVGGKTQEEVNSQFQKKNEQLAKVTINILYKKEPIATLSAKQINLHSNGVEIAERAYLIGRTPHDTTRVIQKITTIFRLRMFKFYTSTIYDKEIVKGIIDNFEEQYNIPAKNALFTFQDGIVTTFRPDEKGVKIEGEQLKEDIERAVRNIAAGSPDAIKIQLKDSVLEPEITLAKSNNLGIEELIAEGTSDYNHSIPSRIHNLTLAASKFNGVIIPKDKVFSFNDTIGDISANTGYQPAYVIQNGRTVLGDGGGVCQVSTTLFRAALKAGLPIIERTSHAYRVIYYENDAKPGLDATVFSPSVDLKIKNDTPGPILIQTSIDPDNMLMYFKFYGKRDNRKVELTEPVVYDNIAPGPPKYEDDPTLQRGITKQVDFAAWGAKSTFNYKVTKDDKVTFEKQFLSVYRPWQAVFLVGIKDF